LISPRRHTIRGRRRSRTGRPDRSKTRFLEDTCTRRVPSIGKQKISLSVHLPEDFSFCGC
jgi:hypothetical protein